MTYFFVGFNTCYKQVTLQSRSSTHFLFGTVILAFTKHFIKSTCKGHFKQEFQRLNFIPVSFKKK